jgi:hypothetical protein
MLEVALNARELAAGPTGSADVIEFCGHAFRLPNTGDLISIAGEAEPRAAGQHLAERCRIGTGGSVEWDESALESLGERLAQADPLAEIQIHLRCPQCGAEQNEVFDVVTFMWAQIDARARRLIAEVHTLAREYGWSEREVLDLSEVRRALYLELAQS